MLSGTRAAERPERAHPRQGVPSTGIVSAISSRGKRFRLRVADAEPAPDHPAASRRPGEYRPDRPTDPDRPDQGSLLSGRLLSRLNGGWQFTTLRSVNASAAPGNAGVADDGATSRILTSRTLMLSRILIAQSDACAGCPAGISSHPASTGLRQAGPPRARVRRASPGDRYAASVSAGLRGGAVPLVGNGCGCRTGPGTARPPCS